MRIRLLSVLVLSSLAACEQAQTPCASTGPGAQPVDRFASGSTFLLPTLARDCAGATWELVAAPPDNRNVVVEGSDGARFTPHVPGVHAFAIATTGEELQLTVIDGTSAPFHHYNYYPGHSIAAIAGAVWTADVYRPTVTSFDPVGGGTSQIAVGPWPVAIAWRSGMAHAVVAQRASDNLGLIDIAAGRIVDAVWVGDEPADVVLSPDGATAYVSLAVSGDVAIVDVARREVTRRIPLVPDVRALALSPDGATLYAARLRSRHPVRAPFADTPVQDERDILVVDTATGAVVRELIDVGTTLRAIEVSAGGASLLVTRQRNETRGNIADGTPHFRDELAVFDAATGTERVAVDLGRQPSSEGFAVTTQGLIVDGDLVWVAAESSDLVVALDAATLEERHRAPAAGRPRSLVATDAGIHVHGPQGFVITTVARGAVTTTTASTGANPRPAAVARGQLLFTGVGETYGADHACHSCHAEGLSDGLVWKVGPIDEYATPRPLFWLEGTAPLGWPAYLSDVRNWGYEGGSTTGTRPTTDEAEDLGAFLAATMPPPAANDHTARDGSLSEQALRGRDLFEGDAGCVGCHEGPRFTSRRALAEGATPGKSDIPSLVGVYRHGVWLKNGQARTLREAVTTMATWIGVDLGADQIDDITRYLQELTGRELFVLHSDPAPGASTIGADRALRLTMSLPVWSDASNLAHVRLLRGDSVVDAAVSASGRHIEIAPRAALTAGEVYRVEVGAGLASFDQRAALAEDIAFTVAATPTVRLDGDYQWTLAMPVFDPTRGGFDPARTVPLVLPVRAVPTASGAELTFDLGRGLTYTRHAVIDGARLVLPALPIPVGPSLADSRLDPAPVVDDDGDGRADRVDGTLTFTGPGFDLPGLRWTVRAPVPPP